MKHLKFIFTIVVIFGAAGLVAWWKWSSHQKSVGAPVRVSTDTDDAKETNTDGNAH